MWFTSKTKLSYIDQSNGVRCIEKAKSNNDMTDRIILVYVDNDTKHLGPIGPGAVYDETR